MVGERVEYFLIFGGFDERDVLFEHLYGFSEGLDLQLILVALRLHLLKLHLVLAVATGHQ